MPILASDIKLLASERLLDTPDGGGRMTGNEVVDGASNNLFADISDLDRIYGRISLRKAFAGVLTDDAESYYGARAIVADAPDDPNVAVTLFTTKSWTDYRAEARDHVERFLVRSTKWPGQVLERQLSGSRAFTLLLRATDPLPEIGQTLVLIQDEGKATEFEQYVRITKTTSVERVFRVIEKVNGAPLGDPIEFTGTVVTCDISDPLRYDFDGPDPSSLDNPDAKVICRDTRVADAATYYGISPLRDAANLGAMQVTATSVYAQLVPSARAETPVADAKPGMITPNVAATGAAFSIAVPLTLAAGGMVVRYFGHAVARGSVEISFGGVTLLDAGDGRLPASGGYAGTVDYSTGTVTLSAALTGFSGTATFTARPAAVVNGTTYSAVSPIPAQSRAFNHIRTLRPSPASGTVSVDYLALGKWYRLSCDGTGKLVSRDGTGGGRVDFATGTVSVTLGALPDADSAILWFWGSSDTGHRVDFDQDVEPPTTAIDFGTAGIEPGSVTLTYSAAGAIKTLTDDSTGGLTGDGTGWLLYGAGKLGCAFASLPDPIQNADNIKVRYRSGGPLAHAANVTPNEAGTVEFDLPQTPVRPKSLALSFSVMGEKTAQQSAVSVLDDGLGALSRLKADGTREVLGAVDYASGHVTLNTRLEGVVWTQRSGSSSVSQNESNASTWGTSGSRDVSMNLPICGPVTDETYSTSRGYDSSTSTQQQNDIGNTSASAWDQVPEVLTLAGPVNAQYRLATDVLGDEQTLVLAPPVLRLRLLGDLDQEILPGSLRFTLGGRTYVDREGALVYGIDPVTNAATPGGTVDYAKGTLTLTDWPGGAVPAVTGSMALVRGAFAPDMTLFRAPVTAIIPGSVQVRAIRADTGETLMVSAGLDGNFSGVALGKVDHAFGMVAIAFGSYVVAEDVPEAEREPWWYAQSAITVDGDIWRPTRIVADSLRFNCVSAVTLPLSADILGIDPVRLSPDGRVPIFRPGDVAAVHHTQLETVASPAPGGTLDLGRVRLSDVIVTTTQGSTLGEESYTADLDAGILVWNIGLALAPEDLPLTIAHRIMDEALVTDVEINGRVSLARPVTHDYPAGSMISSELVIGDLQARAHTLFSQQTWTLEWKDSRIGANTIAQFNTALFPVEVTNRGSIEERWAIIFTNTTNFNVVGESVGQIAVGNTTTDLAPMNPATNVPYFTLQAAGWGAGWAAGNVLRFNTAAANYPVWLARTVLQGPAASQETDSVQIRVLGSVNR